MNAIKTYNEAAKWLAETEIANRKAGLNVWSNYHPAGIASIYGVSVEDLNNEVAYELRELLRDGR